MLFSFFCSVCVGGGGGGGGDGWIILYKRPMYCGPQHPGILASESSNPTAQITAYLCCKLAL